MSPNININLVLEFREIFDEPQKTLDEYLKGISREKMLMVGSYFLGFDNENSRYSDHRVFLEMYFGPDNNKMANSIYDRIKKIEKRHNAPVIIIYPLSVLQLFEYCFENLIESDSQSNSELELNLFKALLLLNQSNTEKDLQSSQTTHSLGSEIRLAALSLSQFFAYSDFVNYHIQEIFTCQIVKAVYLFEFLEKNKRTNHLLNEFLKKFNCSTWQNYLNRIVSIANPVYKKKQEGYLDIIIPEDADFEENCAFIEKLILLDNEPITDIDFRIIRTMPLYKIKKGTYRVVYGLFVIEKIFKGLYFLLRDVHATLPKDNKIGDFKGFYCDHFSEKTLLYEVLKDTYEGRYIEFNGAQLKASGLDAEPDYYLRRGNFLFLFESKDILINATIKTSRDFGNISEAFKKKFYFEEEKGKISNEAVLQLIVNIERVLTKQLPFDTSYKENSIKIYPILVIHDHQYNLPGLDVLINQWFVDELSKLSTKGINISKVKKLTIINIDTLIFYQEAFKSRRITLDRIIDEYHEYVTFDKKRRYRDEMHLEEYKKRTLIPFSLFIGNHPIIKKYGKAPSLLMEKAITIVQ